MALCVNGNPPMPMPAVDSISTSYVSVLYPYDLSTCRVWSAEASGAHGNHPRKRPNHGAARDGLGVKKK